MRTDPRADEVRRIVERVFCDYLLPSRSRHELAGCNVDDRPPERFPRLYEPQPSGCACWRPKPAGRCAKPVMSACGAASPSSRPPLVITAARQKLLYVLPLQFRLHRPLISNAHLRGAR